MKRTYIYTIHVCMRRGTRMVPFGSVPITTDPEPGRRVLGSFSTTVVVAAPPRRSSARTASERASEKKTRLSDTWSAGVHRPVPKSASGGERARAGRRRRRSGRRTAGRRRPRAKGADGGGGGGSGAARRPLGAGNRTGAGEMRRGGSRRMVEFDSSGERSTVRRR
ncbi:unnamed protein product [Phyllotreta striolata]|uniref:Uncharacterized protein n=1 Tax=Phyllotreta striolata TaxID=444603 RepID=A0A9N9XKE2_PHYSR|nr:unnamed protein product [Phyllotreta striolata]